jgi:hypothetical protein
MPSYDQIVGHCSGLYRVSEDGRSGSVDLLPPLENIGLKFSRLRRDQVRGLAVGLSRALVHPGMNAVITADHLKFWDAIGKHLLDAPSLYFHERDDNSVELLLEIESLRDLFTTVVKIESGSWAVLPHNPISKWRWPVDIIGYPASRSRTSEYLVYPLLEAVLKRELPEYFSRSGEVIKEFERRGRTDPYKVGKWCSSIADLLILYMNQAVFAELRQDLEMIFEHIEKLYPEENAINVIAGEWRNPAAHGQNIVTTAHGVVLNIVILLALSHIDDSQWDAEYKHSGSPGIA